MWNVSKLMSGKFLATGTGADYVFDDVDVSRLEDKKTFVNVTFILNGNRTGSLYFTDGEEVLAGFTALTDCKWEEQPKEGVW